MHIVLMILSSLYQQFVLFASCLYLLRFPQTQWLKRRTLVLFFIAWIPIFIIQQVNNPWILLSVFPFFVIVTLALHFTTKSRCLHALLSICVSYFLMLLVNLPFLFVCYLFWDPEYILQSPAISLGTAMLGSLLQFLILRFLPVRQLFKSLCKVPATLSYFFLLFLVILALLCDLSVETATIPEFVKIFLIVLLVLNSTLIFTHQILLNRRNTMELHYYEQYLPVLDNLIQKVRETQHGHNNTIQAILHLIDVDSDNKQISQELSAYTKELQKSLLPSSLLRLENKLLAALLYQKYCQAAESGMSIQFHITNPMCPCQASEFELVDAMGILLDNALEASHPGDKIYVTIGSSRLQEDDRIKIAIDNPGGTVNDAFREQILKKGYTTKTIDTDKHGLGLYILQNMVKKYNGALLIDNRTHEDLSYISFTLLL